MGAIRTSTPWMPLQWLAVGLVFFCSTSLADQDDAVTPKASATTTAPVFLPHYDADAWSLVRGSIIGKDTSASETTYTIFCPVETPPACDLSLEFPFIIVGGPHTVKFHGTISSTYTANVECDLKGTTVATCSGYSSYGRGYTNGLHTGPTEVSWTSTLSGSNVEWGALTMAPTPTQTSDPLGPSLTGSDAEEETSISMQQTPEGSANVRSTVPALWVMSTMVCILFTAGVI